MRAILLIMIGISVVSANDTFVDSSTGLEWQDNHASKSVKKDWSGAKSYCKNLKLSGNSDWRLPKIKELQSIVDISRHNPAIKEGFKNVASKGNWSSPGYWSSSEFVGGSSLAWIVTFDDGYTSLGDKPSKSWYVRCVRGRQ